MQRAVRWLISASLPLKPSCHSLFLVDTVALRSNAFCTNVHVAKSPPATKRSDQELQSSTVEIRSVRLNYHRFKPINHSLTFLNPDFDFQGAGCDSPLFQWLATNSRRFGFLRSNQHRQSEWTWFYNPPSQAIFPPLSSCEQKQIAAPAINTDQLPLDDPLIPDQVAEGENSNSEIVG
jgi:hypothetical protein